MDNTKETTNDAYGRLVQVDERNGLDTYMSTYEYSGLGNLTKLTDSAGNVRNFTYDGLGRRLTAEDLHAPGDTIFGAWAYTYDAAGNLTQQTDAKGQTTNYTYDALNRVLTEDYTGATGTKITYTYDSIGNITHKSNLGDYGYAQTDYANPHAATSMGTWQLSYDNNGNLVSDPLRNYTWDWRNRISSIAKAGTTHTYRYDHNNERVYAKNGSEPATLYPNKYYNVQGSKITKHVFAEDDLLATIEDDGTTASTYYLHTDHLGGTSVSTDETGSLAQLLDYYPYGGIRLNEQTSAFDEQRKFTGQEYDSDTGLHYYVQRYYEEDAGKFLSQDAAFLAIGSPKLSEIVERANRQANLPNNRNRRKRAK